MIESIGDDGFRCLREEPPEDGGHVVCRKGQLVPVDVFSKLTIISLPCLSTKSASDNIPWVRYRRVSEVRASAWWNPICGMFPRPRSHVLSSANHTWRRLLGSH